MVVSVIQPITTIVTISDKEKKSTCIFLHKYLVNISYTTGVDTTKGRSPKFLPKVLGSNYRQRPEAEATVLSLY
jgi:hypothetical protein